LNSIQAIGTEPGSEAPVSSLQLINEEHKLAKELAPFLMNEDASIRPVRLGTKLLSLGRTGAAKRLDEDLERIFLSAASAVSKERRTELEKAGARLDSELLLAFPRNEASESAEDPEELMNWAVDQASRVFTQKMKQRKESLGGRLAGWRRFGQRLVLSLPALILIVRLSGQATIEAWLDHPSLTGGLKIILGFLTALFSSDGLTGLTVLLICELFLVFYLAARRIKRIERHARTLAASAIKDLDGSFDAATHRLGEKRRETVQRIHDGIDRLNTLNTTFESMMAGRPG
jgi:hypothetical protein